MCEHINLDSTKKILRQEQETLATILKVFQDEKYRLQHFVKGYRIELYFIDYNLAIECDERNHTNYDKELEIERELTIKKELKCEFIRYDPEADDFDIFELLREIRLFMKIFDKLN